MEIDISPPAIENIKIDVTTFRPSIGQTITITGEPSELALVTIYVYNQVGVLTRQVDRSFLDANTPFEEVWDGKDSNDKLVTPGKYTFNTWCRDRAGNTAPIYPYELNFTVAIE